MADTETLLKRWQAAGVLDEETAARIRTYETKTAGETPAGLKWQGVTALILGAILLACGVVLFVSAHWDQMGPGARFVLVLAMVAVFHIGGGLTRANFGGMSSALHAVGTVATGAAIALVGQIFNIQEHWPAAVLLWAVAGLFGWMLLRDQAQQTLALLLVPAWIFCELGYRMEGYIGDDIYMGRLFLVWAVLYITFFLDSRRKAVQGILFGVSVIGAVTGIVLMLSGWTSWSSQQSLIPFGTRVWAWMAIAALPLIVSAFHGHKGLIPIAAAIGFVIALPWCYRTWTESYLVNGVKSTYARSEPNVLAHVLVAAFAVLLCWWGVRLVSRALVNLGIAGFAGTVAWFYFSNVMSKLNRSLGLIGLGVLFLAGGWALERMRRRILAQMAPAKAPPQPTAPELNGGAL
ncbi:conserved membrane hypothetical protein [Candidatus Sulfotelmatomonas gaucii]|uniref:DUF2157 domain-containing protein n=1 Tax=Candidatus Sulfuritelmatomonas gaucii TaxID=2043161 RepID=A0A2N9LEG4_9BACT|nr:conserved membrane hypothetical protein [Candidatus Sulfotelmatomonas gaucii]